MPPVTDNFGSKKSRWPSARFASLMGLSAGTKGSGMPGGKRHCQDSAPGATANRQGATSAAHNHLKDAAPGG